MSNQDEYQLLTPDQFRPEHHQLCPWVRKTGEWANYLFRYEMGMPVELVGQDGGDPEDATLDCDFAWVVDALNGGEPQAKIWGARLVARGAALQVTIPLDPRDDLRNPHCRRMLEKRMLDIIEREFGRGPIVNQKMSPLWG